jgi:hypothetical protein
MGRVFVENVAWQNQWKPSLVVVLGNGPVYDVAHDAPRGRHAQFFVNQETGSTVSRNWLVAPFGTLESYQDIQRVKQSTVFIDYSPFDNPWRPAPRLVTDFIQKSDIFAGNDTYGWPPGGPDPPFWVNEQRGTNNVLQFFAAYQPANDMFLLRPPAKYFADPDVFWTTQRPIGAWGTTYIPGTDPTQLKPQAKFFAEQQVYYDFKQPITVNAITNYFTYNQATDPILFRQSAKYFAPEQVYWTPQPITALALNFPPPPYNPNTDVKFARRENYFAKPAIFGQDESGAGKLEAFVWTMRGNPVVINVPQVPPPAPPPPPTILPDWKGRVVLSPKKLGESLLIPVDFVSRLQAGETIATAVVACSVYSGIDLAPQSMINGSATISGTIVQQSIVGGVLGTIYELLYTITTSKGQTVELAGYFVVEPDVA